MSTAVLDPVATGADVRAVARRYGLAAGLALALSGRDVARLAASTDGGGAVPDASAPFGIAFGAGTATPCVPAADEEREHAEVLLLLLHARLGVSETVLAQAVQHLGGRRSGAVAIIDLPAVRMAVADVHSGAALLAAAAARAAGLDALVDLHERVTALDGELLALFGASGALRGSPGHALLLSERVADHWAPRTAARR